LIPHVIDAVALNYYEEFDAIFSNAALRWIRQADEMIAVFIALRGQVDASLQSAVDSGASRRADAPNPGRSTAKRHARSLSASQIELNA